MGFATSNSPEDIEGFEYDWLGHDPLGHLALFSTAGAGYAPADFLRDTDAHDLAIQRILALPATTAARFFPEVGAGCVNTWQLVAERGLYAYDCDPNGGPYLLVAAPILAATINGLPLAVVDVAIEVQCPAGFEAQTVITREMLG